MTQDIPAEGYFYSALSSFVSRTCYANTHGTPPAGSLLQKEYSRD